MKRWRKAAAVTGVAVCAWSMSVFAAVNSGKAAPTNVSLDAEGVVSWTAPSWEGIDRYEIQIVRGEQAEEAKNYKSKKVTATDDTTTELSLSSKGYYYAKVRAYDVSGNYTDWSDYSNMVTVTTEDLSDYSSGPVVSVGNINGGPGVSDQGTTLPSAGSGGPGTTHPQQSQTTSYGWQQDSRGRWYRRVNGTYPQNQWEKIDGIYYHFDAQGYMQTGWIWESSNQSWYYCLPDGKLATGWNNVNEKWYYMDPNSGVMYAGGIHLIDGKYYCMDEKGARIENAWSGGYYYGTDGVRVN